MFRTLSPEKDGFTIVELLIVIVIIGILAAITIVAYGNITTRARDSQRVSDINQVQKALEVYRADNGVYPSVGNDNTGYNLSTLATPLANYIKVLPTDPNSSTPYQYVRGGSGSSYGIRMNFEAKTPCTLNTNSSSHWWSLLPCS